jgi:hypothetical protein
MRKIFAFLMASLDGYHETSSGELFWHNVDADCAVTRRLPTE